MLHRTKIMLACVIAVGCSKANDPKAPPEAETTTLTDSTPNSTSDSPVVDSTSDLVSDLPSPAPSVSLTEPLSGAKFQAPATFTLKAAPGANSTSFEKVDFYSCSTALAADTSSPYSHEIKDLGGGSYTFYAGATDSGGNSATSEKISVLVEGPARPVAKLSSPLRNQIFEAPASIVLNAEVDGKDGGVVKRVEFYNGEVKIGEDMTSPYSFVWANVPAHREYKITARVFTESGQEGVSPPSSITVIPPVQSIAIKNKTYALPADLSTVRYVDGTNGLDANDGLSEGKAWKTLSFAAAQAPAGSTLVIRGGTYRGAKNLVKVNKKLSFQPYQNEKVWIKGSEIIANWKYDSALGLWYSENFDVNLNPSAKEKDTDYVDFGRNPLASQRGAVFVNDKPLLQVANFAECSFKVLNCAGGVVKPGTFCHDYAQKRLYVGDDPTKGKTVEAATHTNGFTFYRNVKAPTDASDSMVRGLGFAHFTDTAMKISAMRVKIEDSTFVWNSVQGIEFLGHDTTAKQNTTFNPQAERNSLKITGNTFSYNGRRGLGGGRAHNILVEGNTISFNNIRRFRTAWDAAGIKLTQADDQVIRGNTVEDNLSTGIWMDVSVTDSILAHNIVRRNSVMGLFVEVSSRSLVVSNLAYENGVGIQLSGSNSVEVWNNTLHGNTKNLVVMDYDRINNAPQNGGDKAVIAKEIESGIDWETRNIVVKNNIFSGGIHQDLMNSVSDGGCKKADGICNDKENIIKEWNSNFYYRSATSHPLNLFNWKPVGSQAGNMTKTLAEFKNLTSFEKDGAEYSGQGNSFFVNPSGHDFRLKMGSPILSRGAPLTGPVANAIGVSEGAVIDPGKYFPKP